jgi:NAD(P)H dehydrogenase (quinone)
VVDAAIAAGAGDLVYTSVLRAGSTQLAIAPEHKETEQAITQSNAPFSFLRNSFCTENHTAQIPSYLARGAIVGAAAARSSRLPHEPTTRLPASPH